MTAIRLNAAYTVGTTDAISVPANDYKDVNISFGRTFTAEPAFTVNFLTGTTAGAFGRCSLAVNSVTTTSAIVRVFNGDTTARTPSLRWIAVGV